MKIDRIELFPVRYPMTGYFKFFAGPAGEAGRAAVIVKVTADDGTVGWGESVPLPTWSDETLETAVVALRRYLVPALVGHDPLDREGAHRKLDAAIAPAFSTGMPITRAGLDIALHDLAGRAAGRPLHELWGRPRGKARRSSSSGIRPRARRYSRTEYSFAVRDTGREPAWTARRPVSTERGPTRWTGLFAPYCRRISARIRATSSSKSNGFVR